VRGRTAAAALIEEDNAVKRGIEKPAVVILTTGARAAVNKEYRDTLRVTALLDMQDMGRFYRQGVLDIGVKLWIKGMHDSVVYSLRDIPVP
jgi:hypothetical protein